MDNSTKSQRVYYREDGGVRGLSGVNLLVEFSDNGFMTDCVVTDIPLTDDYCRSILVVGSFAMAFDCLYYGMAVPDCKTADCSHLALFSK